LVTETRMPRVLLAAVVGAVLAVVGCVLQAIVRNPLADPAILGGTAGASLGAVAVIVLGAGGLVGLPLGAFLGAVCGFGLTFLLASRGGGLSPLRLVLAGVAVSYLFSALTSLIIARADDRALRSAIHWQLGSVAGARWSDLLWPTLLMLGCVGLLLLRARRLDVLAFGDLTATALGVSPHRLRIELFLLTSLLTGVAVALAGGIGFVALVVPHAVRLLTGPRHSSLVPLSALVGAGFLVWADVAARTLAQPSDLPLGVVTALVGAPVFALLVTGRLRDTSS
jgi:iron complex transport system permease protein